MIIGLDIETAPTEGSPQPYALQPWRVKEHAARITLVAAVWPDGTYRVGRSSEEIQAILEHCTAKQVVTWNGVFDIAFLIASGFDVSKILWEDAMLHWKWVDNSQQMERIPRWDLVHAVQRWLPDWPLKDKFIAMKQEGETTEADDPYWVTRCILDATVTRMIHEAIRPHLTPQQRTSAHVQSEGIVPLAESWVRGVELDVTAAHGMVPIITTEMRQIEEKLGLVTPPGCNQQDVNRMINIGGGQFWIPSKILSSPKQLRELLFDRWGHEPDPNFYSEKTQEPSADKRALTYLTDRDPRALDILRWRELNTQYTKFVKGTEKAAEYLGSSIMHPTPRIFSTYTGRITYATKSGSRGEAAKAKVGVPLHQWPRNKKMRELIISHRGPIGEADAANQEMRGMAEVSEDDTLLSIFRNGQDAHSHMGAQLGGMTYESFVEAYKAGNETVAGPFGLRMHGKFTNLSCQYRIGAKKLRIKARVEYGMDVEYITAKQWLMTYQQTYPGVPLYWQRAIDKARTLGYAETFAGRRFYIDEWDNPEMLWQSESSAINFPIQGFGADMKEAGIYWMMHRFPSLRFLFDLHDGLFVLGEEGDDFKSTMLEVKDALDHIPYHSLWRWEPHIPLIWDIEMGYAWGKMEKIT